MTSDEPLPDRCAAECRDGGYCTQYPVGDGDRCRMHGGEGLRGEENPAYEHGAFSEYLRDDLTESELEALDDMVDAYDDPDEALALVREQAAEAWLKYKRSGDHRFLREYRQLADTFNLAPNEDVQEIRGEGGGPVEIAINETVVETPHGGDE